MKEEFLHFVWKNKLFGSLPLVSTKGLPIEVIDCGLHNTNSGPDFFNAKIRIGSTLWAGNVEMHLRSSDWFLHNHHLNLTYQSVILHVVMTHDCSKFDKDLSSAPILILPISSSFIHSVNRLQLSDGSKFCSNRFKEISQFEIYNYLDLLLIERFEEKYNEGMHILSEANGCWNTLLYRWLLKYLGGNVNSFAFEKLAKRLPFSVVSHHFDNLLQLEALLFGVAGFLSVEMAKEDYYFRLLKTEYLFLKHKYSLEECSVADWKFLRLRPANFPTVRIAEIASFFYKCDGLLFNDLSLEKVESITSKLEMSPAEYWQYHYHFGKRYSRSVKVKLGRDSAMSILGNALLPYLFVLYKSNGDIKRIELLLNEMCHFSAEKNRILFEWQCMGVKVLNLVHSQALCYLKTRYCDLKKCISCRIGQQVFAEAYHNFL